MPIPRPSERPSFAQRDAYREVLSDGYAQGRLGDADFRTRLDAAAQATTLRDLEELIADLPRGELPIPEAQHYGSARREADVVPRASKTRRGLAVAASVLVGGLVGFLGGSATLFYDSDDPGDTRAGDSAAHGAEADPGGDSAGNDGDDADSDSAGADSGMLGPVSYDDVHRAAQLAADQDEWTGVIVSESSAEVHVPTESGDAYDVVSVDEDGDLTTQPGGTYGEDRAGAPVDGAPIDGEALAAMVVAAPQVYADAMGETAHPASRIEVRIPDRAFSGVAPDEPVVRVLLGTDEYGGGGGTILWTLDGDRVLEVVG